MNDTIHSHLIAQQVQDRIAEATAARTVSAVRQDRPREPRMLAPKLRLRRRVAVDAPAAPLLGDAVAPR